MFPVLKSVLVLDKRGATNGETVTANIDTLGADWMTLDVHSSTSNNTTNNPSTFKLSEGDTTDATAFSDITAFVGDGTGGWTVPSWHTQTADAKCVKFDVDLRHRKRYLKLTLTPITTQDFIAIANLGRNENTPTSDDQRALVRG